jgi:hypothetical protein
MQKGDSAPPLPARDYTSLVVQGGLLLLFVVGMLTVFGETLAGALFPPAEPPATHAADRAPPPAAAAVPGR